MPRAPAPVPSEPAVFWVWGSGEGQSYAGPELGSAAPAPWAAFRTQSVAPPGLDLTAPGPARHPKGAARAAKEDGARGATAPPALATSQAQRHLSTFQPLPPPHRKIPHSGRLGGRERHWARALSAKISATRVCLLFGPAGRTGPAGDDAWLGGGSSARREDSSRPGRGSPAVLPSQAARKGQSRRQARAENRAGAGGRAAVPERSPPRPDPALLAAAARRSGGKEGTRMKQKPGPRRRLLPHPDPSPSRDAGSILPRRKKMRFTPKSFQERKESGGRGKQRGGDWKS